MIKYIGSKRRLVPLIVKAVRRLAPGGGTVLDLFSGTSRVGHALKAAGYRVLANDHNAYAHVLATCYVQADRERHAERAAALVAELDALPGRPGWFTETYCVRSRFFQPRNGARIEAIRERIEELDPDPELRAVLLAALMEAADRVDSTVGVQMAYLKRWAPRAREPLRLRLPALLPRAASGPGEAHRMDALAAVDALEGDVAYLDPPYNQHRYHANYHVWETLVLWDRPEVYGVACKRADCRTRRSPFNSVRRARQAFRRVVLGARARHLVVSFNDEGFLARDEVEAILRERGDVVVIEVPHPRYVGALIGIHNPAGERVGRPGRRTNREFLFVVSEDAGALERVRALRPASR